MSAVLRIPSATRTVTVRRTGLSLVAKTGPSQASDSPTPG